MKNTKFILHFFICSFLNTFLIYSQNTLNFIILNQDTVYVEDGKYEYEYSLSEYDNEYPNIILSFQNETSQLYYNDIWPGSVSFYSYQNNDTVRYVVDFLINEYEDVIYSESFDDLITETSLGFSSSIVYNGNDVIVPDNSKVYQTNKALLLKKSTRLQIKLPNIERIYQNNDLKFYFDAISYTSSKSVFSYAGVEMNSFTNLGDRNSLTFETVESDIDINTQISYLRFEVTAGSYILDNFKIVSLLPSLNYNNLFDHRFNYKIIPLDTLNYLIVDNSYDKDIHLKSLSFNKRNNTSASFYVDGNFNNNAEIDGGVDVTVHADTMEWHFVSFPFDVDRISINDTIVLSEKDVRIKRFNSNTNEFEFIANENERFPLLQKYVGYIMAINASKFSNNTPVKFKATKNNKSLAFFNEDVVVGLDDDPINLTKSGKENGLILYSNSYPKDIPNNNVLSANTENYLLNETSRFVLIGNPYACYYLMDEEDVFLRYDGKGYDYDTKNIISPFESFFVLKNSSSFTFNETNRLTNKESANVENAGINDAARIKLKIENSAHYDFSDLRFYNYGNNKDVEKILLPGDNIPYIYSKKENKPLLINNLEINNENELIKLCVVGGCNGRHIISVEKETCKNYFERILLYDKDVCIDLMSGDYEVDIKKNQNCVFYLRPVFKTTIEEINKNLFYRIFKESDRIACLLYKPLKVFLYDSYGRLIYFKNAEMNEIVYFPEVINGVYFLKLENEEDAFDEKIVM
ncbi:MAG: hypothetical protein Q4F97_08790 [Bacteroidales bacterium]|nr:hypothetical protein [Bacteroidales bacterium]